MASTYRLGAPERTPARNSSFVVQCCCQRGSSTLGAYRSCTLPPLRHSNASRRGEPGQVPEPSRLGQVASAIQRRMESQVYVSDIARHEGQEVLLRGWLYGKRS